MREFKSGSQVLPLQDLDANTLLLQNDAMIAVTSSVDAATMTTDENPDENQDDSNWSWEWFSFNATPQWSVGFSVTLRYVEASDVMRSASRFRSWKKLISFLLGLLSILSALDFDPCRWMGSYNPFGNGQTATSNDSLTKLFTKDLRSVLVLFPHPEHDCWQQGVGVFPCDQRELHGVVFDANGQAFFAEKGVLWIWDPMFLEKPIGPVRRSRAINHDDVTDLIFNKSDSWSTYRKSDKNWVCGRWGCWFLNRKNREHCKVCGFAKTWTVDRIKCKRCWTVLDDDALACYACRTRVQDAPDECSRIALQARPDAIRSWSSVLTQTLKVALESAGWKAGSAGVKAVSETSSLSKQIKDDYKLLDLPVGSNEIEVKHALKKRRIETHPDHGGCHADFVGLEAAALRLTDPKSIVARVAQWKAESVKEFEIPEAILRMGTGELWPVFWGATCRLMSVAALRSSIRASRCAHLYQDLLTYSMGTIDADNNVKEWAASALTTCGAGLLMNEETGIVIPTKASGDVSGGGYGCGIQLWSDGRNVSEQPVCKIRAEDELIPIGMRSRPMGGPQRNVALQTLRVTEDRSARALIASFEVSSRIEKLAGDESSSLDVLLADKLVESAECAVIRRDALAVAPGNRETVDKEIVMSREPEVRRSNAWIKPFVSESNRVRREEAVQQRLTEGGEQRTLTRRQIMRKERSRRRAEEHAKQVVREESKGVDEERLALTSSGNIAAIPNLNDLEDKRMFLDLGSKVKKVAKPLIPGKVKKVGDAGRDVTPASTECESSSSSRVFWGGAGRKPKASSPSAQPQLPLPRVALLRPGSGMPGAQ